MSTHYRACHLCEAICGLKIEVEDGRVVSVKGDEHDPFSRGHLCPKAVALQDIHEDPDRLRQPVLKQNGEWVEISWDEAIERACDGLLSVQNQHGLHAVGVYQGNPNVHNWGLMTHSPNFLGLLKTRNRYSATSVDQLPAQLMAYWMYGHQLLLPIPDIDHTDYFLMLGANPLASNGSLMTVPDVTHRLKALKARGGQLVVVDPRKTETAELATQYHAIQPAGDTAFLFAIIHTVVSEGLTRAHHLSLHTQGLDEALAVICKVTPAMAAAECGIPAEQIVQIARQFAASPRAVAYGRMGACTQRHGSLAQWAIQILNLITGNLDAVGGALVTQPALDLIAAPNSKPGSYARWHSRVSQRPEALGEFPCSIMAEEILTPGPDQIRAMVTVAGNPVLSTPNGRQLDQALASLDFMVSIDLYINETTRHADLILPTTSPLEHDHYDLIFNIFGVRNQAKYSEATLAKPDGALDDWELMDRLASTFAAKTGKPARPSMPPQVILDMGLQMGPYGMGSAHNLSLAALKANPHGIDLGPLKPSFPARLQTPQKQIEAAPAPVLQAAQAFVSELGTAVSATTDNTFRLIGRRHIRSNNSWMHNSERLVKGRDRCTAMIHPDDAKQLGVPDGGTVQIVSRVGDIRLPVEITDSIMRGVVSVPHGWGHGRPGIRQGVAQAHAGESCNDLTDERWLDELSGNAALNGLPVQLRPA
ncbi:molybdopterin oxidoreductase family protein [Limnobacter humi]|uniref:Molybdopterin oxidoreductase family protein n=1 Tax=Limnobacter humi TaxID=1778671 RepID=A0ABT1WFV5_9BURK|nr:molybdopterin oxidoreductase family protein [Limnobacter humi]MCQ8896402.1 molybdopterin oxidoreductase family protein [Limnobacter humi]